MNDKEAMQALIDGETLIDTKGVVDCSVKLDKEGFLIDENTNFIDFATQSGWKIYESREDKIKRLARDLKKYIDLKGCIQTTNEIKELTDLILEEEP